MVRSLEMKFISDVLLFLVMASQRPNNEKASSRFAASSRQIDQYADPSDNIFHPEFIVHFRIFHCLLCNTKTEVNRANKDVQMGKTPCHFGDPF